MAVMPEDKRISGGWYITRDGVIGRVLQPETWRKFSTIQEAVAEYVVLKLDFWTHVGEPVWVLRPSDSRL